LVRYSGSLGVGVEVKGILPGDDIVESLGVKGVGVSLGERVSGYFNGADLSIVSSSPSSSLLKISSSSSFNSWSLVFGTLIDSWNNSKITRSFDTLTPFYISPEWAQRVVHTMD